MALDRAELLRRPVKTLDEAKRWIEDLHALDLGFHFEDDPFTILIGISGVGLFSEEEAVEVVRRVAELYVLEWPKEFECPITYLLHVEGHVWDDE